MIEIGRTQLTLMNYELYSQIMACLYSFRNYWSFFKSYNVLILSEYAGYALDAEKLSRLTYRFADRDGRLTLNAFFQCISKLNTLIRMKCFLLPSLLYEYICSFGFRLFLQEIREHCLQHSLNSISSKNSLYALYSYILYCISCRTLYKVQK